MGTPNSPGVGPLVRSVTSQNGIDDSTISLCVIYDSLYSTIPDDIKALNIPVQVLDALEQKGVEFTPNILSWLSHYEPSPKKASLVYYVKLFYRVFIPFVIIGLVLQILLHIWRLIVSR